MLMPALSVTAIGVVAAIVGILRGRPVPGTLVRGFVGAWLGFLALAIPGIVVDVILADGVYLALFGHLGAAAGAVVAVSRARTTARTRSRGGG